MLRIPCINYKSNLSTLDGNEQRVMIGAKWEATAQTSGEVKVGQLKKKYARLSHCKVSQVVAGKVSQIGLLFHT